MSRRVYLSGKITGDPNAYGKFKAAADFVETELDTRGVINPLHFSSPVLSYEEQIKLCLTLLDMCDTIYMLQDWTESRGATAEYEHAKIMGKNIILEEVLING